MKKEYIRPELNVLSLIVEDNTNTGDLDGILTDKDDNRMSVGGDILSGLFN